MKNLHNDYALNLLANKMCDCKKALVIAIFKKLGVEFKMILPRINTYYITNNKEQNDKIPFIKKAFIDYGIMEDNSKLSIEYFYTDIKLSVE